MALPVFVTPGASVTSLPLICPAPASPALRLRWRTWQVSTVTLPPSG